jgi:hypothetical protein
MKSYTAAKTVDVRAIIERQREIEGSLLEESAAIWCFLLQKRRTWSWDGLGRGDYLEIGAFKGKSASILAAFTRAWGNAFPAVGVPGLSRSA